ncbi:hypothetical protein BdWA1_000044 [Babesia duncani]|uniref:Uncharacterized protein n=1 Tax=Babesia duncani TaxID=323732 RepID=A0AAD9UPM6_9APIC|nr:hypothetical protein BdWA1_000044 [Babesia duncani]
MVAKTCIIAFIVYCFKLAIANNCTETEMEAMGYLPFESTPQSQQLAFMSTKIMEKVGTTIITAANFLDVKKHKNYITKLFDQFKINDVPFRYQSLRFIISEFTSGFPHDFILR